MIHHTVTADQLREIAEAMDLEEYKVRTSYSGRGMYGDTCVGFDLDSNSELFKLGAVMGEVLGMDVREWGEPSTDGMGMGIIAYFRRVGLAEGESWDEE